MSEGRLAFPRLYLYAQAARRRKSLWSLRDSTRGCLKMLEAARAAALSQIRAGETFAVRVHKRGEHGYPEPAPVLERDAGALICQALQDRDGAPPQVELDHPDLTIHVEVLGPGSLICIVRRSWTQPSPEADAT